MHSWRHGQQMCTKRNVNEEEIFCFWAMRRCKCTSNLKLGRVIWPSRAVIAPQMTNTVAGSGDILSEHEGDNSEAFDRGEEDGEPRAQRQRTSIKRR